MMAVRDWLHQPLQTPSFVETHYASLWSKGAIITARRYPHEAIAASAIAGRRVFDGMQAVERERLREENIQRYT